MDMDENVKSKVVLIEDEELIAQAYKEGLERAGIEVKLALDGQKGLELIKAEKPDLVLLDLIMPGMDGFHVLQILKEDEELKKIPVVVLTVSSTDTDIGQAKKLGVDDYLIKTDYSMAEIVQRVKFRLGTIGG